MIEDKHASLAALYTKHGQEHVFQFINELQSAEKELLFEQLRSIDVQRVSAIYKNISKQNPNENIKSELLKPLDNVMELPGNEKRWTELGLKLIAHGQIGIVTLAGGQGTRLGSSAPKGCYDLGLPSRKSLFQLQAERVRKLEMLAKRRIFWYIMTSGPTNEETMNFFKKNSFFGLQESQVVFFKQGVLPCLTFDGKMMMESKGKVAVAPDGNGGIYASLLATKTLDHMKAHGVKFLHVYCVDNCLVKVGDPAFLGMCEEKNSECASKVVVKTSPQEPVGVLCRYNGCFQVVEYSEISKEISETKDSNGSLMFKHANIANHVFSVDFLSRVDETCLRYHVAKKKIPTINESGEKVTPTTPNGMKLELFLFDVFPVAKTVDVLLVNRSSEFSPLKNAPGSAEDSPETAKRDIMNLHKTYLVQAGAKIDDSASKDCEISALVTYSGEGLDVKGKIIKLPILINSLQELTKL